ncbi:MAG: hypothetical protein WCP22_06130 [Chlamydiota bacterium]
MDKEYVWYVGYGSNLCKDRFLWYLDGKQRTFFGVDLESWEGCRDKEWLGESVECKIRYPLYFANMSKKWRGAVAFLDCNHFNEKYLTYGRMWKIASEQLEDIWEKEGKGDKWYNALVPLPIESPDKRPVYTITHAGHIKNAVPANAYIQVMACGLKESHQLDDEEIIRYLLSLQGIKRRRGKKHIRGLVVKALQHKNARHW